MLDHNDGLVVTSRLHLEWPVSHVLLNYSVRKLSSNQSLGIEDGIVRIFSHLILGGVSDEPFSLSEGDV